MPNHIHAIVVIRDSAGEACLAPTDERDARDPGVPFAFIRMSPKETTGPAARSVGRIAGSFKSAVSRQANRRGLFAGRLWQRGYYERVIRNERELIETRQYIKENPFNWMLDPDHSPNLR